MRRGLLLFVLIEFSPRKGQITESRPYWSNKFARSGQNLSLKNSDKNLLTALESNVPESWLIQNKQIQNRLAIQIIASLFRVSLRKRDGKAATVYAVDFSAMGNIIQLIHQLAVAISRLSHQRISQQQLLKGCRSFFKFTDLLKMWSFTDCRKIDCLEIQWQLFEEKRSRKNRKCKNCRLVKLKLIFEKS